MRLLIRSPEWAALKRSRGSLAAAISENCPPRRGWESNPHDLPCKGSALPVGPPRHITKRPAHRAGRFASTIRKLGDACLTRQEIVCKSRLTHHILGVAGISCE